MFGVGFGLPGDDSRDPGAHLRETSEFVRRPLADRRAATQLALRISAAARVQQ
jgi:hypothetical protein